MKKDRVNILMVDDQHGKLLSYEAILSELGENLIKANSGKEALEHLLQVDVAVVLMDVSMPDMDGFELAEMIREHPRFRNTAIIFISAVHLTDLDRLKGYQRGAVDYISVPVVPELLRAKVSVFAELHRKTYQLQQLNRELEKRVEERTEELARKAETLQALNMELAQKNQQLDAIVTTAPDIIFSRQADGTGDYTSNRFFEYTGAQPESAGASWADYLHPDDRETSLGHWMHSIESGDNYASEYRLRGKDASYRWFRERAIAIRDHSGKIVKWYGTCSDIHDSKLLEQSMRDIAVRLEKMVDERTTELRRLSARLLTMQDEERRRIAREIHDGLGQELAAAKMMVDGMAQNSKRPRNQAATQASLLIDRAIQQIRSLSHLLHPPLLDEVGLASALRWYVDGLGKRAGIEISLLVPPDFPRLSNEVETAIFRIIQEALTNVFRHSGARKCSIAIAEREDQLLVMVCDDGKGVDESVILLQPDSIGIGMGGMRQRAKELGGEFKVSNSNPGTLVEVSLPLRVSAPKLSSEPACASA